MRASVVWVRCGCGVGVGWVWDEYGVGVVWVWDGRVCMCKDVQVWRPGDESRASPVWCLGMGRFVTHW